MIGYVVGGLIRVNIDYKFLGAPIEKGAVVTIVSLAVENTPNGPAPVAVVAPGNYKVFLEHATPVATHDLLHPEDIDLDVEEAESFEEIVDLDPMLRALTTDLADKSIEEILRALEIDPEEIPGGLPPSAPVDGTVGLLEQDEYEPTEDDTVRFTDLDGDEMIVQYSEIVCKDHGLEAALTFDVEDEQVVVPMSALPGLMQWMASRMQKYADHKRQERDGK